MTITSEAQRRMFELASTDKDYADSRGISQDLARTKLEAHKQAGVTDLPERVMASPKPNAGSLRPTLKIFGMK